MPSTYLVLGISKGQSSLGLELVLQLFNIEKMVVWYHPGTIVVLT